MNGWIEQLDSTCLAYVLEKLNREHDYGLNLFLLSIDEGIMGYRDGSLETVNQLQSTAVTSCVISGAFRIHHGRDCPSNL